MSETAYEINPKKVCTLNTSVGSLLISDKDAVAYAYFTEQSTSAASSVSQTEMRSIFEAVEAGSTKSFDSEDAMDLFAFVSIATYVLSQLRLVHVSLTGVPELALVVGEVSKRDKKTITVVDGDVLKEYWACMESLRAIKTFAKHTNTPIGLYRKYLANIQANFPRIVSALAKTRCKTPATKTR